MKIIIEEISSFLTSKSLKYSRKILTDQINRGLHRLVLKVEKDRQPLIFKMLLEDNEDAFNRFQTEVNVLKSFDGHVGPGLYTNKLVSCGDSPASWLLAEMVTGEAGGNIFEFKKSQLTDNFAHIVTELVEGLNSKKDSISKNIELNAGLAYLDFNLFNSEDPMLGEFETPVMALIKKIKLRDREHLSHSDLTPLNFLFSPKGIGIIDWETVSLQDKVFDCAYIYQRFWKLPDWQSKLKAEFFKKYLSIKDDLDAFYCYLLVLLAIDIKAISKLLLEKKPRLCHDKKSYSHDYLEATRSLYLKKTEEIVSRYR